MIFQGHHELRIEPLDEASSQCLVYELLPNASRNDVWRITKIYGNVPLAIKLLCSSISEDDDAQPSQFLETLDESSIVKMLDETSSIEVGGTRSFSMILYQPNLILLFI